MTYPSLASEPPRAGALRATALAFGAAAVIVAVPTVANGSPVRVASREAGRNATSAGEGGHGVRYATQTHIDHVLADLPAAFVYPTEDGGQQYEWTVGPLEVSLELDRFGAARLYATDVDALTIDTAEYYPGRDLARSVHNWLAPILTS